ncbi:hypothetical protein ACZ90_02520 [Streptomyces albus subsp. albus]|nr:hypothetical protein ACZ90_02520 [Streptomyces albus subsp. albus]
MTPDREQEIRTLDLLELMSDRVAPVISGHLAALLGEVDRLRARVAELEAGSPWERAVAGLNALADADIAFWIEPDGHISGPFGDEHIEWDQETSRWVLTRDDDPCRPCGCPKRFDRHADGCPALPDVTEPPAVTADRWNAQYPVGTPVYAYPGCRPEDDSKCTRLTTRTRSAASVLGGHTAVVWVEGHSAYISLTHVDPRPETGGAL